MTLVCPKCFGDRAISRRIQEVRPQYPDEKCSFHPRNKGVPIRLVAAMVDDVFRYFYSFGEYPYAYSEQEGDSLVFCVGDITQAEDEEIARALADQLIEDDEYWPQNGEQSFYADDQNYVRHGFNRNHRNDNLWRNFRESVVYQQRFFNSNAKDLISELFSGVDAQRDHRRQSPVYEISPGSDLGIFYRARVLSDPKERARAREEPASVLGPPPKRLRKAGRMSPAGIACFYGAFDLETCVAELRPPVGSVVVYGKFELTRPIWVLDTTRFEAPMKPQSLFSKDYLRKVEQWAFMQRFMEDIAKPVSPTDEHLDYIPTQAVAEYLRVHHQFKRDGHQRKIDAIIYRSAQLPANRNIAILGEAAEVGNEPGLRPKRQRETLAGASLPDSMELFLTESRPGPPPAIQAIKSSVTSMRVESARYQTEDYFEITSDDVFPF
ncbi:RES family NAD+ phosphorylase [Rhizobium sp. Pop5]|uniref:RES family NAD+ phosphorylase n=1 Tax=Rhizobium sp. Pop5 TaxID=1223565 RepID=UPI00028372FE|nr:RES family NAD+ phosphorylase [Rhizobium sp. Pop5]EJZ22165.1 hypothetical protein RCCGEPOP_06226 [Rhizobium sp. Pop5]UVD56997.1 RES family NAD+ phosphorylase [Rhizobium sp. Pop5]